MCPQKLRNALVSSHRNLAYGNMSYTWEPFRALWDSDLSRQVRGGHKLTESHVKPDSHDKMRVHLAVDMFRPETTALLQVMVQLRLVGSDPKVTPEHFKATVEYCERCWELWMVIYEGVGGKGKDRLNRDTFGAHLQRMKDAVQWFAAWRRSCKVCVPA